ncbi:DUF3140 domain-containing protein [Streptomyces sp. MST-110588]|uniref:DUF3140 domain-containing protein n=1 Tax=Streptomyces sp. MST-110588 TaxID=2833628 RepID=UPI001F5C90A8|nr:DUF3140 domain-containing protein [Streptomyces sp. MST-110588]UNO43201.1 DUF3140 domain-containing protein [Streptomyces sp. MST-110588]
MAEDPITTDPATEPESDALWDTFHRVVNMTSPELATWLRTSAAEENSEEVPDLAGPPVGRHVLAILQKRRTDLTDEDITCMREVIDEVNERLSTAPSDAAQRPEWRHALMSLGHDPLREGT